MKTKLTILDREDVLGRITVNPRQIRENFSLSLTSSQRRKIQRLIKHYRNQPAVRIENEDGSSVWFPFDITDLHSWYLGD